MPTPASRHTLARLAAPRAQADYLACFRADSIVADAELIRGQLAGGEPWSVLGQSFGGFCRSLPVAGPGRHPRGVHHRRAAWSGRHRRRRVPAHLSDVAERNQRHYERYPQDADRARDIARYLASHQVTMPDGGS